MGLFSNIGDWFSDMSERRQQRREHKEEEKTERARIRNERRMSNAGSRQFANAVGYANGIDVNAAWAGAASNIGGSVTGALSNIFGQQNQAVNGGGFSSLFGSNNNRTNSQPNPEQNTRFWIFGGLIVSILFYFSTQN